MATIAKAKSPAPPATAEPVPEVKEKTPQPYSTAAPVEESEVAAPAVEKPVEEPVKSAPEASAASPAAQAASDAIQTATDDKPAEEAAPQPAEEAVTAPAEPASALETPITPNTSFAADRPSRAAAQKAQETVKARATPQKKKSSTNLSGAAATASANKRKSFSAKAAAELSWAPGNIVLARLKGYSPWPAIIVEDDMLPENVLKARPKDSTSKRKGKFSMAGLPDDEIPPGARGSSSGHWPLMFLDNFESFSWVMFTDIMPLDKTTIDAFSQRGKSKDLIRAYENAAKGITLDEIRDIKADQFEDEEAAQEADPMDIDEPAAEAGDEDEEEEEEEEEEAKPVKKTPAKKKAPAAKAAPASSKKRKAEEEAEDTSKTPKKVNTGKNAKTPASAKSKAANGATPVTASKKKGGAAAKDSTPLSKSASKKRSAAAAAASEDDDTATPSGAEKPAATSSKKKSKKAAAAASPDKKSEDSEAADELVKAARLSAEKDHKEKEVMYLRHKIQKLLLTTDKVPTDAEIINIDHYFSKLESYPKLEVSIIKKTKINKVLKALLRLQTIPSDEKYKFKDRTLKLLDEWNQLLANEPEGEGSATNTAAEKSTEVNGGHDSSSAKEKKSKTPVPAATATPVAEDKEKTTVAGKDDDEVIEDAPPAETSASSIATSAAAAAAGPAATDKDAEKKAVEAALDSSEVDIEEQEGGITAGGLTETKDKDVAPIATAATEEKKVDAPEAEKKEESTAATAGAEAGKEVAAEA